ncbi:hypothetical protein N9L06_07145 [Mariniblastus sp.]|nr:hypothetical protein [Mariniblastus sp.]
MNVAKSVSDPRSPWWRWSLKELTVAIGYIAVFLAMVSYMGYQNGMFWLCAIASLIITIVCLIFLPRRNAAVPASIVTLVMFLLCNPLLMFFSAVLAINGLLHFVLMGRAKVRAESWSVKQVLFRSASATLIAFAIGIGLGYQDFLEFDAYRNQIQLTDVSNRLAYESTVTNLNRSDVLLGESREMTESEIPGESEFENEAAVTNSWNGRARALEGIHSGRIEMFVKSPGFGIGRGFRSSARHADYPVLQDVSFELIPDDEFQKFERQHWVYYSSWDERVQDKESLHHLGVTDFVRPASWGFVVTPKQVLGFRPHGFMLPPQNMGQDFLAKTNLKLNSLQLISLLRFESPRAYVLDHLPRMDQLVAEDVPTRELTKFEHASIDQLRAAHKLVRSQSTPDDGLEMVGAIRAYESCLGCHNVCRGDMLGAFTYQFEYASGPPANSSTEKLQ